MCPLSTLRGLLRLARLARFALLCLALRRGRRLGDHSRGRSDRSGGGNFRRNGCGRDG